LKFSFSYFSTIPISFKANDDLSKPNILAGMILFFPLVGLVVSSISTLFYIWSDLAIFGAVVASILYMFLYGFLHSEGLLDTVDAIYAKHSGKDALKVIKEPTIGAIGTLYTFSFVLIKIFALSLLMFHELFIEAIFVVICSRYSVVLLIYMSEFQSSFVNQLKESLSIRKLLLLSTLLLSISFFNIWFILIFALTVITALSISALIKRKLGFLNGDTLGATLELSEILMFCGLVSWVL
jgi:adenosylcobinamide-GDP ribazoletransferase